MKTKIFKYLSYIPLLIMLIFTLNFSITPMYKLQKYKRNFNERLLNYIYDKYNFDPSYNKGISAMLPNHYGYANKLDGMNEYMEDFIHNLLFFLLTLSLILAVRQTKLRFINKIILIIVLSIALNIASEAIQEVILGRELQDPDIINNAKGSLCALLLYLICGFIKSLFKKSKKDKKIIVKYFSGENYFLQR